MRFPFLLPGLFATVLHLHAQTAKPLMRPDVKMALDSIRPSELKGDLSFLASDALEGRYTPSPGLEVAAEFIASKFRAIGLAPGEPDYFQLAKMVERKLPKIVTPLVGHQGDAGSPITVEPALIHVSKSNAAAVFQDAVAIKVTEANLAKLKGLDLDGKVVVVPMPDFANLPEADRIGVYERMRSFDQAVAGSKALLEIFVLQMARPAPGSRFLDADDAAKPAPPVVQVESSELLAALNTTAPLTVSLEIPAPEDQSFTVKNVIGVVRGSDPELKSTCVLVTAHYDHIGTLETGGRLSLSHGDGKDKIYNGANDDGSGTVSVIEIGRALAKLHPKRSIVFMTFFGEERGLLGSNYYGRHPIFPIAKTVADINLEQVGRTDSSEGPEIDNASLTGYDYSDVTSYLEAAGKATGISLYKDDTGSDAYFERSDNAALAEQGVPAHTLTTALEYPDYHGLGDEWQKIDYNNMAKVDRMVALAVFNLANARQAPAWNERNPKTEPFREARQKQKQEPANKTTSGK